MVQFNQPQMGCYFRDYCEMGRKKPQDIVAENLNALMAVNSSCSTTIKLAKASRIGNGTIGRIRQGEVACGIDTLAAIAWVFGLEPWQLLIENLDPRAPPIILGASASERDFYKKLDALLKAKANGD